MRALSSGPGSDAVGHRDRADGDDVADHLDAERLAEERLRHRAQRHPGRGLAGAGALEHRPRVVEAVLLHAGEVGVAGPRAGQRRVAGLPGEHLGVDRVGGHDRRPLGPLGVADRMAIGPPCVRPCRTPPVSSTSSCSNDIRAPRP